MTAEFVYINGSDGRVPPVDVMITLFDFFCI